MQTPRARFAGVMFRLDNDFDSAQSTFVDQSLSKKIVADGNEIAFRRFCELGFRSVIRDNGL
jgi:hypothetical protein